MDNTDISVNLPTPISIYTVPALEISKAGEDTDTWIATVGGTFKWTTSAYSSSSGSVYIRVKVNGSQVSSQYVSTGGSSTINSNFSCNKGDIVTFICYAGNSNGGSCNQGTLKLTVINIQKKGFPGKPIGEKSIGDLGVIFIYGKIGEETKFNVINSEISSHCSTGDITLGNAVGFITIYNPTDNLYYKIPVYK